MGKDRQTDELWPLTQLLLRGSLLDEGDPLQDSPEHYAQREDVCLGRVA